MANRILTVKEVHELCGAALSYSMFIADLHTVDMPARLYGCAEWLMDAYILSDDWWYKPYPRPVGF